MKGAALSVSAPCDKRNIGAITNGKGTGKSSLKSLSAKREQNGTPRPFLNLFGGKGALFAGKCGSSTRACRSFETGGSEYGRIAVRRGRFVFGEDGVGGAGRGIDQGGVPGFAKPVARKKNEVAARNFLKKISSPKGGIPSPPRSEMPSAP